jgi:hypothetical protein
MNFEVHNLIHLDTAAEDLGLLIGMQPRVAPGDGPHGDLVFFDLTHERRFPILKILEDEEARLRFRTRENVEISVRPLTLPLYNDQVKPALTDPPSFKTEDALREHFLVTIYGSPTSPA